MKLLRSALGLTATCALCLTAGALGLSGCDSGDGNGDSGGDTHGHDTEHGDDTEGDGDAVLEWASEHPPTSIATNEEFMATFTVETEDDIHVTELRACMGEVQDCGLGGMESFDENMPATEAGGEYTATMSLPTAGTWTLVAYAHVGPDPFTGHAHTDHRRVAAALFMLAGCGEQPSEETYDLESLQDPATCEGCHPDHHRQWSGSMHAYAAEDPVFVAMNARGQRETSGELGDFCVRCHAPLAVDLGLSDDGLDLDTVPEHLQGVTCYFCHQVDEAPGEFNNPLVLAHDGLMRGPVSEPVENSVHGHALSALHASTEFESSKMCGSCHDVVTPADVHLERTYREWQDSLYADASELDEARPAPYGQSCNSCHMPSQGGVKIANTPDARLDRRFHDHFFAGVDVAVTEFPSSESAQTLAAEQAEAADELRDRALCSSLCVGPSLDGPDQWTIRLWLHNEAAGHGWPSGAAHDRRAWVELVADDDAGPVWSSGVVADGEALADLEDPALWSFHDRALGPDGQDALMFWDVREVESHALRVAEVLGDPEHDTSWVFRDFEVSTAAPLMSVRSRVLLRPIGLEVIDSLIESGDLAPEFRAEFEPLTHVVSPSVLVWTTDAEGLEDGDLDGQTCVSTSPGCKAPVL